MRERHDLRRKPACYASKAMRRLVVLLSAIVAARHDVLRGARAAPAALRLRLRPLEGRRRACCRRPTRRACWRPRSRAGSRLRASARSGPRSPASALIAAASLGFAFAGDAWTLGAARLLQGFGSALSWAGALAWLVGCGAAGAARRADRDDDGRRRLRRAARPGDRRDRDGRRGARHLRRASRCSALVLLAGSRQRPARRRSRRRWSALFRRADRRLVGGMWLLVLPALLFGVLAVLVPLRLHDGGWGGVAIGARLPRHGRRSRRC